MDPMIKRSLRSPTLSSCCGYVRTYRLIEMWQKCWCLICKGNYTICAEIWISSFALRFPLRTWKLAHKIMYLDTGNFYPPTYVYMIPIKLAPKIGIFFSGTGIGYKNASWMAFSNIWKQYANPCAKVQHETPSDQGLTVEMRWRARTPGKHQNSR